MHVMHVIHAMLCYVCAIVVECSFSVAWNDPSLSTFFTFLTFFQPSSSSSFLSFFRPFLRQTRHSSIKLNLLATSNSFFRFEPPSNTTRTPMDQASPSPSQAIDFLTMIQSLKTTKRTGWVKRDVINSESIADHMYRMTIMSLIAGHGDGLDKDKCVKLAAVHDIAEAIVGDITPNCGVTKEEKNRKEKEAIRVLTSTLGNGSAAREIESLWEEYEANVTMEAKLVKDIDKLEMILQAFEYEKAQNKNLEEFFASTKDKFQTDLGRAWAKEITSRRQKDLDQNQGLENDQILNDNLDLNQN